MPSVKYDSVVRKDTSQAKTSALERRWVRTQQIDREVWNKRVCRSALSSTVTVWLLISLRPHILFHIPTSLWARLAYSISVSTALHSDISTLSPIWSHYQPKHKFDFLFSLSLSPLGGRLPSPKNLVQPSAFLLAERHWQMAARRSHWRAIAPTDTANPLWTRKVRHDVPGKGTLGYIQYCSDRSL